MDIGSVLYCPQYVTVVSNHLKLAARVLREWELSLTAYCALALCRADGGPLECADYASVLEVRHGSAAKVLQLLEDRGLVRKGSSARDGRVMEVRRTEAGISLVRCSTMAIFQCWEQAYWRNLPLSERVMIFNHRPLFMGEIAGLGIDMPDSAESDMKPIFLLGQYLLWKRWRDALAGAPVSFAEYRILSLLNVRDDRAPSLIAHLIDMERSQVSLILGSLRERGMVRQGLRAAHGDGRSKSFALTDRGREIARRYDECLEGVTSRVYSTAHVNDDEPDAEMLNAWHLRMYYEIVNA